MLTLFHAPNSRSSRIVTLLDELQALDETQIEVVGIRRAMTQTGAPDPSNPHPEGKVPLLINDGEQIWESTAIALYLTEMFPKAGLGVAPGEPGRGEYLSWLSYYGAVIEPVIILALCKISHPMILSSLRSLNEVQNRLESALAKSPWIMGQTFTAADLLVHSAFVWAKHLTPPSPIIQDWVARCANRPAALRTQEFDALAMHQVR